MLQYFFLLYLYYRWVLSSSFTRTPAVSLPSSLSSTVGLSPRKTTSTCFCFVRTFRLLFLPLLLHLFIDNLLSVSTIPSSLFSSVGKVSASITYSINDICDDYSNDTAVPVCLVTTGHTLNCTDPNGTQPVPKDWPFTNPLDIPPLDICTINLNVSINFTEGSSLMCTRPTLCQLYLNINGTLVVGSSSIIRANTIHIYATDRIFIEQSGIVTSSELGLLYGSLPGDLGNGGTYAGVGGQDQCFRTEEKLTILEQNHTKQQLYLRAYQKPRLRSLSSSSSSFPPTSPLTYNRDGVQVTTCCVSDSYYVSTNVSIGSITAPEIDWNRALGSGGGGFPGEYGGRSGGRINITTPMLYLEGTISADGEISSAVTFAGSGSGGTVIINAVNIQPGPSYAGTISAMGGLATRASFGGGGGGRIVLRYTTFNLPLNNINAGGGGFQLPDEKSECWVGSAGTVFLTQLVDPVQNISFNTLRIYNGNNFAYAVTPLNLLYLIPDTNTTSNASNTLSPDDTVGMDTLVIAGGAAVASTYLNMRRIFNAMTSPPPRHSMVSYAIQRYSEGYFRSFTLPLRERFLYQQNFIRNISNEYANTDTSNADIHNSFFASLYSHQLVTEDLRNLPLPVFSTVGITLSRAYLFPLVGIGLSINTSELILGDRAYVDAANLLLYVLCSNISQSASSEIYSLADIVMNADHTVDLDGDVYYQAGPLNKPQKENVMTTLRSNFTRSRYHRQRLPLRSSSLVPLGAAPVDALVGVRAGQTLYVGSDADISVTRLLMYTPGNITIAGRVETVDTSPSLCTDVLASREICLQLHWGDNRDFPPASSYTLVLDAPAGLIEIVTNGKVSPQIGIFCAEIIKIDTGAAIAGNGEGCSSDEGWGAGSPSAGGAGSGAGHAGVGGVSSQGATGGVMYDNPNYPIYPGSGGGSAEGNGGLGGAYLVLAGQQIVDVVFGALVTVDGENGGYGGGGSGGAILVETFRFTGGGYITLNGGDGSVGGGGGSGGIFRLRSALLPDPFNELPANLTLSSPAYPILGDIATTFSGTISIRGGAGSQGGGNGANGTVVAPPCPPGSQLNTVQAKCVVCGPGFWRNGTNGGQLTCARCTNAPSKGLYTDTQSTISDCVYVCPPGTLYPSCDTPLEQLVKLFGGEAGFAGSIGGVMACLLLFLLYCLRKRVLVVQNLKKTETLTNASSVLGNWGIGNHRNNTKNWSNAKGYGSEYQSGLLDSNGRKGGNYGSSTPKLGNNRFGIDSGASSSNFNSSSSSSSGVGSADRLAFALALLRGSGDSYGSNAVEIKRMQKVASTLSDPTTLNFLISACAMQEADLPRHATRIYLGGSNAFGSSWRLPWDADRKLRKHVRSRAYANFAETVNGLLQWPRWGWEEFVYTLLTIAAYPFAYSFLRARRRYRSVVLMQYVLGRENSHKWLKGTKAHALQNGLRIGVSADFTLAYIDVLHTEANTPVNGGKNGSKNSSSRGESSSVPRTLSVSSAVTGKNISVHTPRLPIGLLFAGDGSFEKPFYLDANDVLVRSVPSVPGLSRFIDGDWLEFVAEMNARARCIAAGAIVQTIGPLLTFIAAVNADPELLGGLRIEIVRYWPCAPSFIDPTVDSNEDMSLAIRTDVTSPTDSLATVTPTAYTSLPRTGGTKDEGGKLTRKPSTLNTQRPNLDTEGGTTTEDELTSHSGSENLSRRDSFDSTQSSNKEDDEENRDDVRKDTKGSLKIKIHDNTNDTRGALSPSVADTKSKMISRNRGASTVKPVTNSTITTETTFERLGFGVDSDDETTMNNNGSNNSKPRTAPSTTRSNKDTNNTHTYSSLQNEDTLSRFDSFLPREFSTGSGKYTTKSTDNEDDESVYGDDMGNDGPASNRGRHWWTSMTSLADDVVSIADARLGLLVTMQGLASPLLLSATSQPSPSPLFTSAVPSTDGSNGGRMTIKPSGNGMNGVAKTAYDPVPARSTGPMDTVTTVTNPQNYLTTNNLHSLDDFDTFQFTIGDDGIGGVGKPILSTGAPTNPVPTAQSTGTEKNSGTGSTKPSVSTLQTLPYPSSNPKSSLQSLSATNKTLSNQSEGPLVTSHLSAYMANGSFSADSTDGDPDAVLCSKNESINCFTTTISDIIGTNYIDIGGDYDVIGKRINLHLPYPGVIMKPLRKKDLVHLYWTAAGWLPTLPGIRASPNWHDMDALFTASQYYMHQQEEQRDAQNKEFMVDNKKLNPSNDTSSLGMDADRANRYQRNVRSNGPTNRSANGYRLAMDLFGGETDFIKRVIVSATRLAYESRAEEYRRRYRFPPRPPRFASAGFLAPHQGSAYRIPNSNWYTDTERGFGSQNNGGLIIGNHSRPKVPMNMKNKDHLRFNALMPSGLEIPSSSYPYGYGHDNDRDSIGSYDDENNDHPDDEQDNRYTGYSNHYQYWNESAASSSSSWFTSSTYNTMGGNGSRSSTAALAVPAAPQWFWSAGITPWNLCTRIRNPQYDPHHNFVSQNIIGTFLWKFSFVFCRCLRRSTPPLPQHRNWLYFIVVLLHIALIIIEISMTMILVAQLWCIEPTTDIGTDGNSNDNSAVVTDRPTGSNRLGFTDLLVVGECSFSALVVYLAAPPLTCILPPLLGLAAVASGSSRGLRIYTAWNGFSIWSTLVALAVVVSNLTQLGTLSLIFPFLLLLLKFSAAQLVPIQLVAIETARPVRGWRGLFEVRTGPIEKSRRMELQHKARRK